MKTNITDTDYTVSTTTNGGFHSNLTEKYIGITFTILLMVFTLFINTLICWALIRGRHPFNTAYAFILNLCAANFLIAIFSMPWWVMVQLYDIMELISMLGLDVMQFFVFIDILGGVASILSLTVISVVRWVTVTHPLNWMVVLTIRRCVFIILGVWVYGIVVASLKFVKWPRRQSFSLIVFVVGFALPFTVLGLAYGRMLFLAKYQMSTSTNLAVWKSKYVKGSERVEMLRSFEWETKFRCNFKGSRTMAIVTGTFLMSWLPFFVISLCYSFNPGINLKVALTAKWLGYSNAAVSPLVYTVLDRQLKRAVYRVIRSIKHWCYARRWSTPAP